MSIDERLDNKLEAPSRINKEASLEVYTSFRREDDQAIKIGLFGEDLERALQNPDTVFIDDIVEGEAIHVPVLVPLDSLEWYNFDLIKARYGEDAKAYYYSHPPTSASDMYERVRELIVEKIDSGYVIVAEKYIDDIDSPIAGVISNSYHEEMRVDAFGREVDSRVDVFAGVVTVGGSSEIFRDKSLYETYLELTASNEIVPDPQNGVSMEAEIVGEEAEAIWRIYENPFKELGSDDPVHAGFGKEDFLGILKDKDVTKIINRVDGAITTLCIFLHDFSKAPWFNSDYYAKNFPAYFETGNILMFPGIVSDEMMRGNNYSMDLIALATKLTAKRGTAVLITFECTEVSSTYIPEIVTAAINSSGNVNIEGLDRPIDQIEFFALSKV